MKHWIVRGIVACGLLVAAPACFPSGGGGGDLSRHPMPAGVAWDGKWDTSFGPLILETKGNEVIGVYKYNNGGNAVIGVLKGAMSDNVLDFKWAEQEGGAGSGRGTFYLSDNGNSFDGTWGTGNANTGGRWKGQRM